MWVNIKIAYEIELIIKWKNFKGKGLALANKKSIVGWNKQIERR